MKTVEQLAREAKLPYYYRTGEISNLENLQCFHDLAIAQYRESLLAGVGEPYYPQWSHSNEFAAYTADQLAAAVAIERERCAKVCEGRIGGAVQSNEWWSGFKSAMKQCAAAIRGQR